MVTGVPHTVATEVMRHEVEVKRPELGAKLSELLAADEGDVIDVLGTPYRCNGASPWLAQPTFEPAA